MRINHNIPALNAHRMLNRNANVSASVLERLSSGKKINRAADDAAGMAISEKMKAQVRGLAKAAQNTLDGISLIQTAEGAMNEVHSMLQRMRELAVQAANGTTTNEDRIAIQAEINQLTSEINRIANGTEFNTRNVLRGNEGPDSNTTVHRMSTGAPAIFTAGTRPSAKYTVEVISENKQTIIFGAENGDKPEGLIIKYDVASNEEDDVKASFSDSTITITLSKKPGANTAEKIQTALRNLKDNEDLTALGINASEITVIGDVGDVTDITLTEDAKNEDGDSKPTVGNVFAEDSDVVALGNLASDQLYIEIDGKLRMVNLDKLDGTLENATRDNLLETLNDAMGDLGRAVWNNENEIEIRTTSIGGTSEIKITGTAASKIFGYTNPNDLRVMGTAEKDTGKATGSFYFNGMPGIGSVLTIGNDKIEFFDSSVAPYTGSNRAIDTSGVDDVAGLVERLEDLGFEGVTLKVDDKVKERLIIISDEVGFKGQAIFIEGTPKEFVTNLQVGPNQGQGFRLSVGDIRAFKLNISSTNPKGNTGVIGAAFNSNKEVTDGLSASTIEHAVDVSTEETATSAITVYNNAIVKVAQMRGALGAIQNRLEYTAANLENTQENLTAALSRIEDTDMALEMSEFTKYNILIQAGTAMLAQANQRPQTVLQLLGG